MFWKKKNVERVRWAVVGTGAIAHRFVSELSLHPEVNFHAVSSTDSKRGRAFAEQYGIPHVCVGLDEMLERDDIDAAYIATVHPLHVEQTLACLHAGKAVLSEKPLGVHPGGVENVMDAVEKTGVFAMEAMKSIHLPAIRKGLAWQSEGRLGEVRQLRASFCFKVTPRADSRLFDPRQAGGCVLDVGYYGIEASRWFLGLDEVTVSAVGSVCTTGVEDQAVVNIRYPSGAVATTHCAISCPAPVSLEVLGTEGRLHFDSFNQASAVDFIPLQGRPERFEEKQGLFRYEVEEVHRCLREGLKQSDIMPLRSTWQTSCVMDSALRQIHQDKLPAYLL
ncbi:MAG: Gfo/Idh/MocA family protein [Candidatus Methylacidiphilales bacterium]